MKIEDKIGYVGFAVCLIILVICLAVLKREYYEYGRRI